MAATKYTEDSIKSLEWHEHIRLRPGMYIGKLGDGQSPDDGIYVLVKEIIDNSIDEFVMGAGKKIEINIDDHAARVRDYGRGIPLGKVIDCVSKINTGGKYDSEAFQSSERSFYQIHCQKLPRWPHEAGRILPRRARTRL